jgi:hypothetical protein
MERKYCRECGEPLKEYFTGHFNEKTGEKEFSFRCENIKCEYGCGNIRGHKFPLFSLFGYKCKNCGYVQREYY